MTRYDVDNGIVEIHHTDGRDKWLVVRKELTDAGKVTLHSICMHAIIDLN